jgi:crossover junction endodeoxyribonuclease RusA
MLRIVIPGEPYPKERARAGRGGFYTPKQTQDAQETVRNYAFLEARKYYVNGCPAYPTTGHFWLGVSFYLGNFRSKRGRLTARDADLDNLVKLVKDALQGVIWVNDKQVRGFLPGTKKVLGNSYPQTIIVIAHEDKLIPAELAMLGDLPA